MTEKPKAFLDFETIMRYVCYTMKTTMRGGMKQRITNSEKLIAGLRTTLTTALRAAALVIPFSLFTFHCSKPCPSQPPALPPGHYALTLKAQTVSIRRATLTWNNDSVNVSWRYVLVRGANTPLKDTVFADTVYRLKPIVTVTDTGLAPGTQYAYTVYRIFQNQRWDSSSVSITTLAITNPNMTTQSYGFGEAGSYLRGIWASSPTDVWMCG
ncbi:MAG: hypothetical protein ACREOZ_02345, partial [Gloeomargaritales cyanobacterium]